ncbi:50S ribosomal protein L10 [Candidatus Microgenomates bacterium]|nr:50S ribosomal protein L10 [Candidatus Microgenomates bacterium]
MPTQRKTDQVKLLKDKLSRAKAIFLAEYRGLTHQQLEQLRRALKKVEAELVVAKNTLVKIALSENKFAQSDDLAKELKNPTATLFIYGDEIAPIRELAKFMKTLQLPKIKIGVFSGKLANEADFQKLATIPTREILLATLVGRLNSPIQGLHSALSWNIQRLVTVLGNVNRNKSK